MNKAQIQAFLERYGQALSTGDLPAIAACWAIPSLVLSETGAMAVSTAIQVESFFSQAVTWYHEQEIVATQPQLEQVTSLGERLAAVDVRWASLDKAGAEQASERAHYILHQGDDGQPRIQVALTRTA